MGFLDNIQGTFLEDMVNKLTSFLQKLASGDAQAWYDFGKSFANFTARAVAFGIALKGIDKIIGTIVKVVAVAKGIGKIGGVFSSIGGAISKALPFLSSFFAKLVEVIALTRGGAGTLGEAIHAVFNINVPAIMSSLSNIGSGIVSFFAGLGGPITAIIIAVISGIVAYLLTDFEDFKAKMQSIWTTIKDEALAIWDTLKSGFIRI